MKLNIDISKLQPNAAGELLRAYCFTNEGYGCYENFNLNKELNFIKQPSDSLTKDIQEFLILGSIEYITQQDLDQINYYNNGIFSIVWYWDGDGTLMFIYDDNVLYNTDCKKDYNWKSCKISELKNNVFY